MVLQSIDPNLPRPLASPSGDKRAQHKQKYLVSPSSVGSTRPAASPRNLDFLSPPALMSPPAPFLRHTGITPVLAAMSLGGEDEASPPMGVRPPMPTSVHAAPAGFPRLDKAVRWTGLAAAGVLVVAALLVVVLPTPVAAPPPATDVRMDVELAPLVAPTAVAAPAQSLSQLVPHASPQESAFPAMPSPQPRGVASSSSMTTFSRPASMTVDPLEALAGELSDAYAQTSPTDEGHNAAAASHVTDEISPSVQRNHKRPSLPMYRKYERMAFAEDTLPQWMIPPPLPRPLGYPVYRGPERAPQFPRCAATCPLEKPFWLANDTMAVRPIFFMEEATYEMAVVEEPISKALAPQSLTLGQLLVPRRVPAQVTAAVAVTDPMAKAIVVVHVPSSPLISFAPFRIAPVSTTWMPPASGATALIVRAHAGPIAHLPTTPALVRSRRATEASSASAALALLPSTKGLEDASYSPDAYRHRASVQFDRFELLSRSVDVDASPHVEQPCDQSSDEGGTGLVGIGLQARRRLKKTATGRRLAAVQAVRPSASLWYATALAAILVLLAVASDVIPQNSEGTRDDEGASAGEVVDDVNADDIIDSAPLDDSPLVCTPDDTNVHAHTLLDEAVDEGIGGLQPLVLFDLRAKPSSAKKTSKKSDVSERPEATPARKAASEATKTQPTRRSSRRLKGASQ